jgi:hypothetical protein
MQKLVWLALAALVMAGCKEHRPMSKLDLGVAGGYGSSTVERKPGGWTMLDYDSTHYKPHEISIDSVVEQGNDYRIVYATSIFLTKLPCYATGWEEWYWYQAKSVCYQTKGAGAKMSKAARTALKLPYWETVKREERL